MSEIAIGDVLIVDSSSNDEDIQPDVGLLTTLGYPPGFAEGRLEEATPSEVKIAEPQREKSEVEDLDFGFRPEVAKDLGRVSLWYRTMGPHNLSNLEALNDHESLNKKAHIASVRHALSYLAVDETDEALDDQEFASLMERFYAVTAEEPVAPVYDGAIDAALARLGDFPEVALELLRRQLKNGWQPREQSLEDTLELFIVKGASDPSHEDLQTRIMSLKERLLDLL